MIRLGTIHVPPTRKTPASVTMALVAQDNGRVRVHGLKVYHEPAAKAAVRTLAYRFGGRGLTVITNAPEEFRGLGVSVIQADVDAEAKNETRERLRAGNVVAAGGMSQGELAAKVQRDGTFFEAVVLAALEFEFEEENVMKQSTIASVNVSVPIRAVVSKGGTPRAAIGVAKGQGNLTMYGASFGPSAVAALCAVEPFTDAHGRRSYCVTACATVPADRLREAAHAGADDLRVIPAGRKLLGEEEAHDGAPAAGGGPLIEDREIYQDIVIGPAGLEERLTTRDIPVQR